MPTSPYFCRILFLDSDQPVTGLKMNYTDVRYTNEKQFTLGSGPEADIQVQGTDVDPIHIEVKIEGSRLFVRNLSQNDTQLSSYKVPFDKIERYTPGEAIRMGQSKQVIFVELFRKFVDPISESEAIIREAWERANEAEQAVEEHKQALVLLQKQSDELIAEVEKEAVLVRERARKKAEEIEDQALQAKDQLIKETLIEKEAAAQKVHKDLERKVQELHLAAEENARNFLAQARQKNKELKREADREIETLQLSAQNEAKLTIEVAKKRASELSEDNRLQIESLAQRKTEIEGYIQQALQQRSVAFDSLGAIKEELKGFEEQKKQLQREHDLEKERLRLSNQGLHDHIVAKESEIRAMEAKVEDFSNHLQQMTAQLQESKLMTQQFLEKCQGEAEDARVAKESFQAEADRISHSIKELTENMRQLESESAEINHRVVQMRADEIQERDRIRAKLQKEYEVRKEFELKWLAQQRHMEQENAQKEKVLQERLEQDHLLQLSHDIVSKILPLLSLEISSQLSSDQSSALLRQMEKLIAPIVERSVIEEYEFRREQRSEIQPAKVDRMLRDYKKVLRKQYGVAAVAVFLFVLSIVVTWSKVEGLQVAYLTFGSEPNVQQSSTVQQQPLRAIGNGPAAPALRQPSSREIPSGANGER